MHNLLPPLGALIAGAWLSYREYMRRRARAMTPHFDHAVLRLRGRGQTPEEDKKKESTM